MNTLFVSTFLTLTTLLFDLRAKCRKPAYQYIVMFFLLAAIGFFFDGLKAEASELLDIMKGS